MPGWVGQVASALGGGGAVWALVALYRARLGKPMTDAAAVASIAKTSAEMVANANLEIQRIRADAENRVRAVEAQAAERLSAALQDVTAARREATEARQAVQQVERVVEMWYRRMSDEAFRPGATVERWRELVASFPPNVGVNGAQVR